MCSYDKKGEDVPAIILERLYAGVIGFFVLSSYVLLFWVLDHGKKQFNYLNFGMWVVNKGGHFLTIIYGFNWDDRVTW